MIKLEKLYKKAKGLLFDLRYAVNLSAKDIMEFCQIGINLIRKAYMWCEVLENNEFLKSLYTKVPDLKDVYIFWINIHEIRNSIYISFDMPYFVEKLPEKWLNHSYNMVSVGIRLENIHKVMVKSERKDYRGDIEIYKDGSGLISFEIIGTLQALIKAESAIIASVEGGVIKRPCEVDCQCCCDLR